MSRICCSVTIELLSDTILYSGYSVPGGEALALRLDDKGFPLIPASTVKGLLRQSVEDYLCWTGGGKETLDALFGRPGLRGDDPRRHLIFGDLKPGIPLREESEWSSSRVFVKTGNEEQIGGKLRSTTCLRRGLVFTGLLLCDESDRPLLEEGFRGIRWMGLMRNRGFGWVKIRLDAGRPLRQLPQPGQSRILRYRLRLLTPMTVSWLSRSGVDIAGSREFVQSRDYLPGAAMRGMVLSALALRDKVWFLQHKEELLKKIRFLNAFPMAGEESQIPTPGGFYADKAQTRFYSVLSREVEPGDKRARLGGYCRLEADTIRDYAPTMTTLLRIDSREYGEFSYRAISADTVLEGYILLEDASLADRVASSFTEYVSLGADRYAGLGLCRVECLDTGLPDFLRYSYGAGDTIPAKLYMMLLGPATMTRFGEPVGIDEEQLARALGVGQATVERCATGFTQSSGYNRRMGGAKDAVTMYEMGSMFCLSCDRAPTMDALRRLELEGIGIRRQEGYGQVLFLRDFEAINRHEPVNDRSFTQSDSSRFRQKRLEWLSENASKFPSGLNQGHKRTLQNKLMGIINGTLTQEDLDILLAGQINKESDPKTREVYLKLSAQMDAILNTPLAETIHCPGCPDPADKMQRYRLLLDWLEINKKGGRER